MSFDETHESALVLLDALSAFDVEIGETPENGAAVSLALERLQEVDAITVLIDDETGEVTVNGHWRQ